MSQEECVIFQCIQAAKDRGIWTKELKSKTGLHQTVLNKIIKGLESRKIIKSVKNIKYPSRKTYMLYDLEPSEEFTGGPWFEENELDIEFINDFCKLCHKIILSLTKNNTKAVISEICKAVLQCKVLNVKISLKDVLLVLNRMIYDRIIEIVPKTNIINSIDISLSDEELSYIFVKPCSLSEFQPSVYYVPCGTCRNISICNQKTFISVKDCIYMDSWIDFNL